MTKTETHRTHLARRAMLAAAVSVLGLAATARAQPPQTPLIDLKVIDRETGEAARVWRHAGRLYVAGNPGARYALRVTNNTGGRVLAVMSVDGVNILTGETAGYGQRGYVFGPYETYEVNGWRKSDSEIAAFNFSTQAGSYAAQTGRPNDVGVIGVAVFRERVIAPTPVSPAVTREERYRAPPAPVVREARRPADAVPPPPLPIPPVERRVEMPAPPVLSAPGARTESVVVTGSSIRGVAPTPRTTAAQDLSMAKLGTGHGAREWSTITTVPFTRMSREPQYIYRVEYDSRERLMASGVIPRPRPLPPGGPRPFPASPNGYVPDPPRGG